MKRTALILIVAALIAAPVFASIHLPNYLGVSCNVTVGEDGVAFKNVGIQMELPVARFRIADYPVWVYTCIGYSHAIDNDLADCGLTFDALLMFGLTRDLDVKLGGTAQLMIVDGRFEANAGAVVKVGFDFDIMTEAPLYAELDAKYMFLDMTGSDPLSFGAFIGYNVNNRK